MSVLKRVATRGFLFFQQLKGTRKVTQAVVIQTERANSLRVIHRSGYDITIYCQRMEYLLEHARWVWPARKYETYHLFSTTTNDAPELIRQACKLEATLPRLYPWFLNEELQKRSVIDAYVDLITDKLLALKQSNFI
jgi:hypothetical protein